VSGWGNSIISNYLFEKLDSKILCVTVTERKRERERERGNWGERERESGRKRGIGD
jgi:hypothetical protein